MTGPPALSGRGGGSGRWLRSLVLLSLLSCPAEAQEPAAEQPSAPADLGPATRQGDVYLNDSFEADDWIAQAARRADGGEWNEAVGQLRRAVEVHADKLTRAGEGRYVSVVDRVNGLIASWPPEGLEAYRRALATEAGERLAAARGGRRIGELLDLADRYFCTPAAAEAMDLAARLAVEQADFALAARLYERLLREHPDRERLGGSMTARLALVYAMGGRAADARRLAGRLPDDATVEWMGEARPLAGLIGNLAGGLRPRDAERRTFSWPTFGGGPHRNGMADLVVDSRLAVLWQSDALRSLGGTPESDLSTTVRRALTRGRFLELNPVVADERVFVQDSRNVWALRLGSGTLLWHYVGPNGGEELPALSDSDLPRWYGPTVAGGRVYACLGREVIPYYGYEPPESASSLVCLDGASGRLVWRVDRARLGESFEEMEFESSPLVADGKVYVVVRRKRAFGFQDCFLCRFDAADGRLDFRTHLGSASTGGFGYRRPTLTIPALHHDTVFAATNLGTIAAVGAHTGRVRWLRLYERISETRWRREGRGSTRELNPWQYNAVVCAAGRLFALPMDADGLLVLDCHSGDVLHRVPLAELANARTLLGVDGPRVYGVGEAVFCYDAQAQGVIWDVPLPEGTELMGRGVLTRRQALVPARSGLLAFDLSAGLAYAQPWDGEDRAGNLVATSDLVLAVGNDRVTAYARKEAVLEGMRRRMADAPQDPLPALDLAEVLFRSADVEEALRALDQAVERAGGFAAAMEPEVRERVFADCLEFAAQLAGKPQPDFERIDGLYRRASQCPPDTPAHLLYRLRWAAALEQGERWAEAVGLYQQIIADRTLREAPCVGEGERPGRAGHLAEASIDRLMARHGRQVYAAFEREAGDLVAAGRSAGDLELLGRVAETYPNSRAALQALRAQGELLRGRGGFGEAAAVLSTALFRYPEEVDAPGVLRAIADCYVQAGRPEDAWRWLTKAVREHPTATLEVDGRWMGFAEYRDRLGEVGGRVEPARPQLVLPLKEAYSKQFDQPFWILDPRFGELPGGAWQHLLVYSEGTVQAYDPATGDPVWTEAVPVAERPELLAVTADYAVLATRYRVVGLDPVGGRRLWEYGRRPAGVDDPETDPEDFSMLTSFAVRDGRLAALADDGRAVCLELASGRELWHTRLERPPLGLTVLGSSVLVYQTAAPADPLLCVLDARTGEPLRVIETPDTRQAEHLLFTLDGHLLVVTSQTVTCFSPRTGGRCWQVERPAGIRAGTVRLDVDGLYLSDDRQRVEKLRLTDGLLIWRSEPPLWGSPGPDGGMSVRLYGGQVVVSTEGGVHALSARDGRVLWEGTTRRGMRFGHRFLTGSHFLGVHAPAERFEEQHVAFFYDLGNATGLIPSTGGIQVLEVFKDARAVTVRDGALLVQAGRRLHAWVDAGR